MELRTEIQWNYLTDQVIGCAIEVHRELGPGLVESVYHICLLEELINKGFKVDSEVPVNISYKGKSIYKNFYIDLLVENSLVLELKAVENLHKVHEVQLYSYLKLADKRLGLLINFHEPLLIDGVRRVINGYFEQF